MSRTPAWACLVLATLAAPRAMSQPPAEKPLPAKAPAESLDGPPLVTAKAWAVADGTTGKVLWGGNQAEPRPMASTTKIMTALLVLELAEKDPKALDEVVTFSERAAKTTGSSSKLKPGEKLPVKELFYGMLLPSGNDAAVALAEHFGPRFPAGADPDPVARFVAAMNQRAKSLGLMETSYTDPNGLSKDDLASARDLATLTWHARKREALRTYTSTRRHTAKVQGSDGERSITWETTNKLLEIDGYDGVKTGTTTPAGQCLVASGARGEDRLIVVVLGSTSTDGRYVDARNLFRWAWQQRAAKTAK